MVRSSFFSGEDCDWSLRECVLWKICKVHYLVQHLLFVHLVCVIVDYQELLTQWEEFVPRRDLVGIEASSVLQRMLPHNLPLMAK